MYIDKQNVLGTAQAVTASAASTDYLDIGAASDLGVVGGMHLMVTCTESATAAGAATMSIAIQCDDNSSFSSAKTVAITDVIGKASLVASMEPIFIPLPIGLDERYIRAYYTVATGPLTAGKFSAVIVAGVQKNKSYPDAL